jgi:hypothetical protein
MTEETPWTGPQRRLAELLVKTWVAHQRWPVFQWVEARMRTSGHDAREVLMSFPVLGGPHAGGLTYSDVRFERSQNILAPEGEVALTIGGLSRVEDSSHTAEMFVAVLNLAARTRRRSRFNPVKVKPIVLTMKQSEGAMAETMDAARLKCLSSFFSTEPILGCESTGVTPNGESTLTVGPAMTAYAGIDVTGYLRGINKRLTAKPRLGLPRTIGNPLSLATALTYLDTTWQLHSRRPLLLIVDAAAVTSLAFSAATAEEFTARCSALADVLSSMQAPSASGVSGHALDRCGHT